MTDLEKISETIHDLLLINNDRAVRYEKAAEQIGATDNELKVLFIEFAVESRFYAKELDEKLALLGTEDGIDSTTFIGKIYNAWMDIKFIISGSDRNSILASCGFSEDAIKKAYDKALENGANMDSETRHMIEWQRDCLRDSCDLIKNFRGRPGA